MDFIRKLLQERITAMQMMPDTGPRNSYEDRAFDGRLLSTPPAPNVPRPCGTRLPAIKGVRLIRSTLFLSAGLAIASVVLTSLWIGYGPRQQVAQDKRVSTVVPLSKQERTGLDAKGQAIRTITPGSTSSSGMVGTAPSGSSPSVALSPNPAATLKAFNDPDAPERQSDIASIAAPEAKTTPAGTEGQFSTPNGNVDLNTATVEQLNGLGAGMIGKRIIEFRPYASTEDLISRRVLKRSDYDAIKGAVTVR